MSSSINIEKASELIWKNYIKDSKIDNLPEQLKPKNRQEAYNIQGNYKKYTNFNLFGWKIAATSKNGQKHIGVRAPIAGRLFNESIFKNNSKVTIGNNKMAVAEPEFAFKIKKNIIPRAYSYSIEEIAEFVAELYPAIEIPNSRFNKFKTIGEELLIADNACAHQLVLGEACPDIWKKLDLSKYKVNIYNDNGEINKGIGLNVLGSPLIALTWLSNELSKYNISINKNMIVTTGTCSQPLPIKANDIVVADFGKLGKIRIQLD